MTLIVGLLTSTLAPSDGQILGSITVEDSAESAAAVRVVATRRLSSGMSESWTQYTDADGIYLTRAGVPTGLVSVPNRYMHSPNELVSISDLRSTAELIAAFIRRLGPDTDFTPR